MIKQKEEQEERKKAFIFDWSGTLNNNFKNFKKICDSMFNELGKKPISEKEIKKTFTLPYMKFWNKHFPDLTKNKQDAIFIKHANKTEITELYAEVKETLLFLRGKNYELYILSSDPINKLIKEVKETKIYDLFEQIIGNIHEKDKVLTSMMQTHKLDKENTYYVGDTSGDIEAGKTANIKTIGITWGYQEKKQLKKSKPDYLINNIADIKNIIKN